MRSCPTNLGQAPGELQRWVQGPPQRHRTGSWPSTTITGHAQVRKRRKLSKEANLAAVV